MIEIIKRGTKTKHTCNVCGCEFTYEAEDVQIAVSPYHGGGDTKYIDCPQCSHRIYLEMPK
jgi:DNA-directed RNA polymerase subunit RPC12/RpoP